MIFHVVVQDRAKRDISDLYGWIARRSPDGAARWLARCEEVIRSRETNPERLSLAPESVLVQQEIRQIIFRTRLGGAYRALCWIDGTVVRVLHVRGPGQPTLPTSELE